MAKQLLVALFLCFSLVTPAAAQTPPPAQASLVYLDSQGVIRWRRNDEEVRLFGANYCAFSGQDHRMAGRIGADRKAMIETDMAHFARMGWDGLRLCSWGDWENADANGNLIENEHLDLMDYLIAKARERGIYMLFTPIHTYNPNWPDRLERTDEMPGFSRFHERAVLGTDQRAIAAQVNYIRQSLNHVNPYTGLALKDEPAILFVEMINEPVHHPEDLAASIAYVDALVGAVRSAGSAQITFHNVSQDFRIAEALGRSRVDGVSFGWYPSGLVAGRTMRGNFLHAVDHYPDMLRPEIARKARIVYEFDQADLLTGYMYPAMARTYRSVGAQFAAIFAYDMLETAPYNLGWQTHFVNLVHTPQKAVSAVIAAEAMRRLERRDYGRYPENLRFGDFRVCYDEDLSELAATDAFMHAGDTLMPAPNPRALTRIVGFGSSPLVDYEGEGAYFLDKVRDGVWRLEVYPDALLAAEPFAQPQPGRIVSRLYFRAWPMRIGLPDLGTQFFASPVVTPTKAVASPQPARNGMFTVEPGVWLLSRTQTVDPATLPSHINRVGFSEYRVAAPLTYPDLIDTLTPAELPPGVPVRIRVRVAAQTLPETVTLHVRPAGSGSFAKAWPMRRAGGHEYGVTIPAGEFAPGLFEYVVSLDSADHVTTFPGPVAGKPGVWPFAPAGVWTFRVTPPETPIKLFEPERDYGLLSFVRPEERYRAPFFHIAPGETGDESALSLSVPDLGADTPPLYAAALHVGEAIQTRGADVMRARTLCVRFRASRGARKTLELLLIEQDGSSWRGAFTAGRDWTTARLPLDSLEFSRSIHIPSPFPGLWNYWREGAPARAASRIRPGRIERLELRVRRNAGTQDDAPAVEIASVWLE